MKFSNKLSLNIFATGVIVLILLSFFAYKISCKSLLKSQFALTKSVTVDASNDIDQVLREKVKTAITMGNTPIIRKYLEISNISYTNMSDEERDESITRLNEKWKTTKDPTDKFILNYTENKASRFLKDNQQLIKGEFGEIFITNKFGVLIASTSKLSTFAHGHKYWWLGAYNNGNGMVFFDDRGYDDSVKGYVLGVVVPIRQGEEIIGILKCNINILGVISKIISPHEKSHIGRFKLVRSGGMIVFEKGFEPLSTKIDDSIFKKLKINDNESFIIDDSDEEYLVGLSEVELTKKGGGKYGFGGTFESIDHQKGNLGESWYVINYRKMSDVLANIKQLFNSLIWIGIAIILILVLVSKILGQKISQPLVMLDKAAKKIGEGDFENRVDFSMNKNDELYNLFISFNSMANKLQQTTISKKILEDEIEHRKLIEKSLSKSEEKFRIVFEISADGILITDIETKQFKYANPAMCNMLGYTAKELMKLGVKDIHPKKSMKFVISEFELQLSAKKSLAQNIPCLKKNGEVFYADFNSSITTIAGTKCNVGFVRDITEKNKIENALRVSEMKFKSLFDNMSEGFALHSMIFNKAGKPIDYVFLDVNKAFEKITTLVKKNIINKKVTEVIPGIENDPADWINVYGNVVLTGKPVHLEQYAESLKKWYFIVAFRPKKGQFAVIIQDITNRKNIEDELQKIQKLESVGVLAGGIAHDFNNLLSGVIGNLNIAQMVIDDKKQVIKKLKETEKILMQTSCLTNQLLTFSKGGVPIKENFHLPEFIQECAEFALSGSDVELNCDFDENKLLVIADKGQIRQVIQNLAINVKQVLSKGGVLTILCEDIYLNDKNDFKLNEGSYVKISVTDNGKGISQENLSKIFDPYFTTKSSGSGLGLAVVFSIIQKHNGYISAKSIVGKGTTLEIYLPGIKEKVKKDKKKLTKFISGKGKILVMDDEEFIRKVFRDGLSRLGFEIETAKSGEEAIELYKSAMKSGNLFDLVTLDLTVKGGMGGKETVKELIKIDPSVKAIAVSGYATDSVMSKPEECGFVIGIAKPCTPSNLATLISQMLTN